MHKQERLPSCIKTLIEHQYYHVEGTFPLLKNYPQQLAIFLEYADENIKLDKAFQRSKYNEKSNLEPLPIEELERLYHSPTIYGQKLQQLRKIQVINSITKNSTNPIPQLPNNVVLKEIMKNFSLKQLLFKYKMDTQQKSAAIKIQTLSRGYLSREKQKNCYQKALKTINKTIRWMKNNPTVIVATAVAATSVIYNYTNNDNNSYKAF